MPEAVADSEILNLRQDFPPVSTAAWEAAIAKDLKGADYEKKLVWRTEEGLAVRPYYRKEALAGLEGQLRTAPGRYPFVRGSGPRLGDRAERQAGSQGHSRRPAARSRRARHPGAGLRNRRGRGAAGRADGHAAGGDGCAADRICLRGGPELLHRDRQTARRAHAVGAGGDGLRPGRRRRLPHAPARAHAASATRACTTATPTCCASPPKRCPRWWAAATSLRWSRSGSMRTWR